MRYVQIFLAILVSVSATSLDGPNLFRQFFDLAQHLTDEYYRNAEEGWRLEAKCMNLAIGSESKLHYSAAKGVPRSHPARQLYENQARACHYLAHTYLEKQHSIAKIVTGIEPLREWVPSSGQFLSLMQGQKQIMNHKRLRLTGKGSSDWRPQPTRSSSIPGEDIAGPSHWGVTGQAGSKKFTTSNIKDPSGST